MRASHRFFPSAKTGPDTIEAAVPSPRRTWTRAVKDSIHTHTQEQWLNCARRTTSRNISLTRETLLSAPCARAAGRRRAAQRSQRARCTPARGSRLRAGDLGLAAPHAHEYSPAQRGGSRRAGVRRLCAMPKRSPWMRATASSA